MSGLKKPFYLQPPWNILFDFRKIESMKPWEVNISFLLTSFLEEMDKQGETDFRASGVVLDSSALIYLMKSKLLLKLEKPLPQPSKTSDFTPPPLFLPLRYELTSTTIQQLLQVLDDALRDERFTPLRTKVRPILPPPPEILPQIDLYLMEIEKQMNTLYQSLLKLTKKGGLIVFSKLIRKSERLEAIRTFILILFLAQRGKVGLWQETEFGEIYIALKSIAHDEGQTFGTN